ncbi:LAFA_0G03488g1_1 [Lachancea sp. 'fantastica']|nr:LAFA_0G03488g1_1 [Lachancea sp. 'fantastica']
MDDESTHSIGREFQDEFVGDKATEAAQIIAKDEHNRSAIDASTVENHDHENLSLADQRASLSQMYEKSQKEAKEGDPVYVIPSLWFDRFLDPQINEKSALGPLNTSSICRDYDNFVLADYNSNPYISVPQAIFEKLLEWYGLSPGSRALKTVLVKDENGQLAPEYDRCYVRLHLLKPTSTTQQHRYSNGNKKPLFFATSRLSTLRKVIQKCLEVLGQHESDLDLSTHQFRIWQVEASQNSGQSSQLSQCYLLDSLAFAKLPIKKRFRPNSFDESVRALNSSVIDLVTEFKRPDSGDHWPSNYYYHNELRPPKGIVGLSNLGNSCYMNSALQCLVHIPELRDYFLYGNVEHEINTHNPLGYSGQIARNFASLIKSLFDEQHPNLTTFLPRAFKSTLGHHNSMFSGYLQQDSQEFLSFLLDGLHEDLNRIVDKPFVEKPELSPNDDVNDEKLISRLAKETKDKHKLRNDSVINDLFTGMYKSTLTCPACNKVSVTFDPFSDLTLPLPVESFWSSKILLFPQNSPPCVIEVELAKGSTYQDLKHYIAKAADLKVENLIGAEVFNHAFYNNYESASSDSKYLPINDLASEGDTIVFYEVARDSNTLIVPVLNTEIEEGFPSPKLFGYPFFIALSKDDLNCYGAIKKQLEKHYGNLSGNFIDSQSPLASESSTAEAPELLKKKYPNVDFTDYKKDIENSSSTNLINHMFSLKILNGPIQRDPSSGSIDEAEIWAPDPRVNVNASIDVTTLMNNVTKDIYDHQKLVDQKEEIEDYSSLISQQDNISKPDGGGEGHESDMDVDNDCNVLSSLDNAALAPNNTAHSLSVTGQKGLGYDNIPSQPALLGLGQALICQWNSGAVAKVFSDESEFSWDRPAELRNPNLEAIKEERSKRSRKQITIEDCLNLFSKPEVLGTADSWFCPRCREHRQATKQIQLWDTPEILIIHLKRFENRDSFSDKITDVISFPITGFDMSSHLASKKEEGRNIYDLVAVDNHYGGLGGGHYTAYAKNAEDDKWYYFDDSRVTETNCERSVSEAAYLLFYRRREIGSNKETSELREQLSAWRQEHNLKIEKFNKEQEEFYQENPSEEDEGEDGQENSIFAQNSGASKGLSNSVASLEVGSSPLDSCPDENDGRRKLRLLHKNYTSALPSNDALSSSATGSDASDEGEAQPDEPTSPNL